MRVLVLSPYAADITRPIEATGDAVMIGQDLPSEIDADFVVSYGLRQIIKPPLLDRMRGRMVNIHIAMLPWNRGADPNFWSWIEGTPKGVSIHHIDAGIDTGLILAQRAVSFGAGETLATSYAKLKRAAAELFAESWPAIRAGKIGAPQPAGGTFHRARERELIWAAFPLGYDTPVEDLERYGATVQLNAAYLARLAREL
jgi:methionyl-tRNA formyltransferase